jgi:tungstate transport system permease protein
LSTLTESCTFVTAGAPKVSLVVGADAQLLGIVALSLKVSLSAVFLASCLGLPIGAAIAVGRFPGRRSLTVILNGLMGLPPVVVGLLVYLLLSRAGPLGAFGLLFTPTAMVIAQVVLITPIVAALSRQIVATRGATTRNSCARSAPRRRAPPSRCWSTRAFR